MENYFARNIQYLRSQKNMDRQTLADKLGVGLSTVACWENGLRTPNMEMLGKIIKLFNVQTDIVTKNIVDSKDTYSNDSNEIDQLLFSKAKDLSDEDKMAVMSVIDAIKRKIDNEEN